MVESIKCNRINNNLNSNNSIHSSRMMKQSNRGIKSIKQSIGNDSDMDFDLALD